MNLPKICIAATFAFTALVATGLSGCKSDADKCRDENNDIYAKDVAACKDAACKTEAATRLKNYLAACDGMK